MAATTSPRFARLVALLPDRALAAACSAAFVVALGYGIVVPAIPPLLERLLPEGGAAALPLHTGGLTGVYTIAIFLFAPLWGRLSDRLGQRALACVGLVGYALALVLFLFATDIRVAYVTRILAGIFAAGIGPVIQALITETVERAAATRRFAALGAFTLAGALVGPSLAGWIVAMRDAMPEARSSSFMVGAPLYVTALMALLSAAVLYRVTRRLGHTPGAAAPPVPANQDERSVLAVLAALNLLLTFGLGSFEVGIALRVERTLGLDARVTAVMFMICSLAMVVTQASFFFASAKGFGRPRIVGAAAFSAMAAGFALLPLATNPAGMTAAVSLVAAAAGAGQIMLAAETVVAQHGRLASVFGRQLAFASLGQGLGSLTSGLLFQWSESATFLGTAGLMGAGAAVLGFGLGPARWRTRRQPHWDSHV